MGDYCYKTKPYPHQEEDFLKDREKDFYAYFWDMGLGKSKVIIDTAAWLYGQGKIQSLVITAPNGVHRNWIDEQVPTHAPDHTFYKAAFWEPTQTKKKEKELADLLAHNRGLRIYSASIDSVNTERGYEMLKRFLVNTRALWCIDESTVIKNMISAKRTNHVLDLSVHAPYRRICDGTPANNSPVDLYSQFLFLKDDFWPQANVYAFRQRYLVIEMQGKLRWKIIEMMDSIILANGTYRWGEPILSDNNGIIEAGMAPTDAGVPFEFTMKPIGKNVFLMKWRMGQREGAKKLLLQPGDLYPVVKGAQRLDELHDFIAPYSSRRTKDECLDLPPKIYTKRYVPLSTAQEKIYKDMRKNLVAQFGGKVMSAKIALTKMLRLQQVVGGFFVEDDTFDVDNPENAGRSLQSRSHQIDKVCPRVEALLDCLTKFDGKVIIWALFRNEVDAIVKSLIGAGYSESSIVQYHGGVNDDQRTVSRKRFQDEPASSCRFFVASYAAAKGLNLVQAKYTIYYSRSYSLDMRLQSEDRNYRIGQDEQVTYIDLCTPDTVDDRILAALRSKKDVAAQILGDELKNWI